MKSLKTVLEYAKYYVNECGYSVIPLKYKDKRPEFKLLPRNESGKATWEMFQYRYPSDEELKNWFTTNKTNIGIVTGKISNISVVDLDSKQAIDFAIQQGFPNTTVVKTSKGYHLYYVYRKGQRNFQSRADLPGIDFRADGGYVVAPPSIHKTGDIYTWKEGGIC